MVFVSIPRDVHDQITCDVQNKSVAGTLLIISLRQTMYNNSLAISERQLIFNTQRYAWSKYVSGGSFWTAVSYSTALVDGEGTQRDYWSYTDLIANGVILPESDFNGTAFC
jgi:glucan 1,3-beta-glucosidase